MVVMFASLKIVAAVEPVTVNNVLTQSVVDALTKLVRVLPERDAKSDGVQDCAATDVFWAEAPVLTEAPFFAAAEAVEGLVPSIWCGARSPTAVGFLATTERSEVADSGEPWGAGAVWAAPAGRAGGIAVVDVAPVVDVPAVADVAPVADVAAAAGPVAKAATTATAATAAVTIPGMRDRWRITAP
ncbi:hypothetical protein GCM10009839_79570 [Catenulispora yoronensis]|uniref:Secreted protein n=1 Tax=Catenulispora yoronensis TaxID=450799 RepID=A0ABN2VD84_9ACTN